LNRKDYLRILHGAQKIQQVLRVEPDLDRRAVVGRWMLSSLSPVSDTEE
jgi:hypothetical protein